MFDVGGGELLLIVLAVLVLFGPKKLPEIAQMINKGMKHVRKAQAQFQNQMSDLQHEIKDATDVDISNLNLKNVTKPGKMARDFIKDNIEKPIEKELEDSSKSGFTVKKPAQRIISRDEIPDEGPDYVLNDETTDDTDPYKIDTKNDDQEKKSE